jgi:hypothetical protein
MQTINLRPTGARDCRTVGRRALVIAYDAASSD